MTITVGAMKVENIARAAALAKQREGWINERHRLVIDPNYYGVGIHHNGSSQISVFKHNETTKFLFEEISLALERHFNAQIAEVEKELAALGVSFGGDE